MAGSVNGVRFNNGVTVVQILAVVPVLCVVRLDLVLVALDCTRSWRLL